MTTAKGALDGLHVLDLTQFMAGPFATMILADLGADIVKIESPGRGDQTRHALGTPGKGDDTLAFHALNRNKRSLTLDLKTTEGLEIFHQLAGKADVIMENFRPGVVHRLGIDYESVAKENPGIIYASISGFGQTGPYAGRPGFDLIAQAMGGIMSVTGSPDGTPVKAGVPIADLSAGLFAVIGILSAHASREKTGLGQYLETSLLESAIALSVWESAELWATGNAPQPLGSAHRLTAPYQAIEAMDGFFTMGAANQHLWVAACGALQRPDLPDDPRFGKNTERMKNLPDLIRELEQAVSRRSVAECVDALLDAGVPAAPIYDYRQVFDDEHVKYRQMKQHVIHPVEGETPSLGFPIKMNGTPASLRSPAPLLGEHSDDILRQLGLPEDTIRSLRQKNVI